MGLYVSFGECTQLVKASEPARHCLKTHSQYVYKGVRVTVRGLGSRD